MKFHSLSINKFKYKAKKGITDYAQLSLGIIDFNSQTTTANWEFSLDLVRFPLVYDLNEMDFTWHLDFQPLQIEIGIQEGTGEPKVLVQNLTPHFLQLRNESPFYAIQLQNSILSSTIWCKQL